MREITVRLFRFSELSESAKQKAVDYYVSNMWDDCYWSERVASYEAAKEIYKRLRYIDGEISGARLVAWIENNLAWQWTKPNYVSKHKSGKFKNCYFSYKYDEPTKVRRSRIFRTNTLELCPLTGVCYDYDFLEPIINFLKKPSSSITNMDLKCPDYERIAQREIDYMTSFEGASEELTQLDYEYLVDGTFAQSIAA